jgi:hypothetical protein
LSLAFLLLGTRRRVDRLAGVDHVEVAVVRGGAEIGRDGAGEEEWIGEVVVIAVGDVLAERGDGGAADVGEDIVGVDERRDGVEDVAALVGGDGEGGAGRGRGRKRGRGQRRGRRGRGRRRGGWGRRSS